jgi:hypothetical protein
VSSYIHPAIDGKVGEGEPPPSWDPVPTPKGIKFFVHIYGLLYSLLLVLLK